MHVRPVHGLTSRAPPRDKTGPSHPQSHSVIIEAASRADTVNTQWSRALGIIELIELGLLQADEDAVDLLSRMVRFDPTQRISATEALQHKYFTSGVTPSAPGRLPRPKSRKDAPLTAPPPATTDPVLAGAPAAVQAADPGSGARLPPACFAVCGRFVLDHLWRCVMASSVPLSHDSEVYVLM